MEGSLWVNAPRDVVFDYFSNAMNLSEIARPKYHFTVLTPAPIEMFPGRLIDYKMRMFGLPIRWQSRIPVWEPPFRFVDEQMRGPYRRWHHEHRFTDEAGGTRVEDTIHYDTLGGALANRLMVEDEVREVFVYRNAVVARKFP